LPKNAFIDTPTRPSASGSKRSPTSSLTSSSVKKRAKHILPEPQLTALNDKMKRMSDRKEWQVLINKAECDDSVWLALLSEVLMHLTGALASTNMKGRVITSPNFDGADEFVKCFNNEVFEEWKVGVREGVGNNDWTLIAQRTTGFHSFPLTRTLTCCLAILRIQSSPLPSPRRKALLNADIHRE
jgi:hypothetical protein